jgi:hypothetical protein
MKCSTGFIAALVFVFIACPWCVRNFRAKSTSLNTHKKSTNEPDEPVAKPSTPKALPRPRRRRVHQVRRV